MDDARVPHFTATRSAAQVLSGHSAVVWIDRRGGCVALDRVTPLQALLARPSDPSALQTAAAEVVERADRLMHRESTDFIGRINAALMHAEGLLEGDTLPIGDPGEPEYREHMIELASLALAQAALVAAPAAAPQAPSPETGA